MAIFGKLAYDAGVGILTLLFVRFAIAAPVLWLGALRRPRAAFAGRRRRTLLAALALGAVGYAMQAGLYFAALARMDASLLSMLLYTFPAMVTVAAIALGRETASRRRTGALLVSSGGLALVLLGAGAGAFDWLGAALGLGAALTYTAYILVSDRVGGELRGAAAVGADHHGRGDHVRPRLRGQRLLRHRLRERGLAVAGGDRDRLDGHADRAVLRRAAARRPVDRLDPLDARAADDRRARVRGLRRDADRRSSWPAPRSCSAPPSGSSAARAWRSRCRPPSRRSWPCPSPWARCAARAGSPPRPARRPRARGCARAPRSARRRTARRGW